MIGAPHRLSLWACTSQVVVLAGCAPLAPSAAIASGNIKIVSSRPRIGGVKTQTDTIANAIRMALGEVNTRVADAGPAD